MVLWKKESTSADACYINLVTQNENVKLFSDLLKVMCEKSVDESTELRMDGNQQFKAKKWPEAMELYNQSLRYATGGSENISLAYANRSLCFFQMKKYDQCLVDIDLAKKANYPQRLMQKLKDREAACLKIMNDEPPKPEEKVKPALSFDADERFPSMASVLEIRNNDELGNHIVAKCDIDAGKIVIVDEMFVTNTHGKRKTFCKTCSKSAMNFIPCRSCSEVMFCDDNCLASDNNIHAMSCKPTLGQSFAFLRIVESILIAAFEFPDASSFMEFVERALATPSLDTPTCNSVVQRKYSLFLKLNFSIDEMDEEIERIIYRSHQSLLEIPEIKRRFQTNQEKRFLMHLILQHHFIFTSNGTIFREVDLDTCEQHFEISGISLFQSLLKYSCFRNATFRRYGNQVFIYVVRPVKKGEQLIIEDGRPLPDGQCNCSKCVPKWRQEDNKRLESENDYDIIMRSRMNDYKDFEKRTILKAKLVNLLNRYGRLPWSPALHNLPFSLDHCMQYEFQN